MFKNNSYAMDFLSNSLSIDEMDNVRWQQLFVAGFLPLTTRLSGVQDTSLRLCSKLKQDCTLVSKREVGLHGTDRDFMTIAPSTVLQDYLFFFSTLLLHLSSLGCIYKGVFCQL